MLNSEMESSRTLGQELTRSKQRISDHGEVFTPNWMVEDMLDLVSEESARIDSRFLEPACGSGNFLKSVLTRKLETVNSRYGKSDFEKRHYALFALMSIYGIELLGDNVAECRENLLQVFIDFVQGDREDIWSKAAMYVLNANVLQGDALSLTRSDGLHIEFPEWGYLGAGKFQRRDFRFDALTQRSSIKGTLFELFEEHQLFVPTQTYPPMKVEDMQI